MAENDDSLHNYHSGLSGDPFAPGNAGQLGYHQYEQAQQRRNHALITGSRRGRYGSARDALVGIPVLFFAFEAFACFVWHWPVFDWTWNASALTSLFVGMFLWKYLGRLLEVIVPIGLFVWMIWFAATYIYGL
ncbi:MAG: hypothetical protein KKH72_00740 [Alphaproteobacteria bacterium]|nr:hypothetical protein [Alphaproteobacteria bacterium]